MQRTANRSKVAMTVRGSREVQDSNGKRGVSQEPKDQVKAEVPQAQPDATAPAILKIERIAADEALPSSTQVGKTRLDAESSIGSFGLVTEESWGFPSGAETASSSMGSLDLSASADDSKCSSTGPGAALPGKTLKQPTVSSGELLNPGTALSGKGVYNATKVSPEVPNQQFLKTAFNIPKHLMGVENVRLLSTSNIL